MNEAITPPRVLVADDDDAVRRLVGTLLRSWGFEPVLAADGPSALAHLRGAAPPRAAIVDWMMPGLSGMDILRTMEAAELNAEPSSSQSGPRVRPGIVVLTAKGSPGDLSAALEAGADDFVTKPFDPLVLRARLEATLRRHPAASVQAPLDVGSIVDGRYRLDERIGSGGMGAVYRATHLGLRTEVAVKVLRPDRLDRRYVRERFEHEARATASVASPHVASVLDCGVAAGQPYLVMELLRGHTLEWILEREGPFSLSAAASIVTDIGEAIEAAHRVGLVHRDLKPGNVFLAERPGERPIVKVIDFGLARAVEGTASDHVEWTGQGEILGTVGFMSPSQLLGEPATVACDLWALAATAAAMVIGRSPFEEEIQSLTILNTLQAPPPRLSGMRAGVPVALDAWAETAFAREPGAGFSSASELAYAFAVAAAR